MTRALVVALTLAGAACGTGGTADVTSTSFPAAPLASVTSSTGKMLVEVRASPQPPQTGSSHVQLKVRNASTGAPVEGLAISVTPWMPAMGHGGSVTPTVTEMEPGVYVVTNLSFFMPGRWELRSTLSPTEHVEPAFDVQ
jgi:hypothetical protein